MRTQETFHLIGSANEIRVAFNTDGDRVGGLLNEQSPMPVGEGEPAFDYRLHIQHLVVQLDSAVDGMTAAEDEHSIRLIRVSRSKSERDEVTRVNTGKLVAVRQGLESLYPEGGFELAFLSGDTPREPNRLVEQLDQTVKLLKKPAVELRQVRVAAFQVDLDNLAAELESGKTEVRAAIDNLEVARKEAEGTLVVKQKAIDELRRIVLWVSRTGEGLFHLAGESELAGRIRSSTRRPRRPSEEAAEQAAGESAGESGSGEETPETEPEASESPASS